MQLTTVLEKNIQEKIKLDPKVKIFALARELDVPEQAVMECLPENEVVRVGSEHFDEIMAMVATWGKVTTIVQTGSMVLEAKGMLPMGSHGHGYFNLMGDKNYNVGGHIRADLLSAVYFVERPFMGIPSMSVQFFDLRGEPIFKIYLGRDDNRQLLPDQVEAFQTLRERLTRKGATCACCA
jgi:putative heme utilization carrier protein HutX